MPDPVSVSLDELLYSKARFHFLRDHGNRPVVIYVPQSGAWWRPGCMGHTYQHSSAGVFSLKRAYERSSGTKEDIVYQFID